MPSRRNTAASQRAAAISLPGGFVVLMRRYCDKRAAASSPSAFHSPSPRGTLSRATRRGGTASVAGAGKGPASGEAGGRAAHAAAAAAARAENSNVQARRTRRPLSRGESAKLERPGLSVQELAVSRGGEAGPLPGGAGTRRRLVHGLVGQLERPPMNRHHRPCAQRAE